MDAFYEQVVKCNKTTKTICVILSMLLLTVLIPVIFILLAKITTEYLFMVAFFSFTFMIYVDWYVISSQRVEFEYSVVSDEITISKIIAQRKRKGLIKFSAKTIEDMRLMSVCDVPEQAYDKTVIAGNDNDAGLCWASVYNEKKGKCLIVFSPDENLINTIKPYLKRSILTELLKH